MSKKTVLDAILALDFGETCYPTGRADESVSLTHSAENPYYLFDRHGYEYWFIDAKTCARWLEGDREGIEEGVHFL